jgi:hypothetical protein
MHDIALAREILANKKIVWEFLSSINSWSEWIHGLESVSLEGDFVSGSCGKLKLKGIAEREFKLLNVVEEKRIDLELYLPMGKIEFKVEIEAVGSSAVTRHFIFVTYSGFLSWFYKFLTKTWLKGKLSDDFVRFTDVALFKVDVAKEVGVAKENIINSVEITRELSLKIKPTAASQTRTAKPKLKRVVTKKEEPENVALAAKKKPARTNIRQNRAN